MILGLLPTISLFSQTTVPELAADGTLVYEEESPPALFEYSLNDSELEFFLLGSWQAKLGFAVGASWIPRQDGSFDLQPIPPSILHSTPLTNIVDLVTSLWIDEQFFFEASFRTGFTDNSILAGYYGEGILREAKIGNTDIGIQSYPFLQIAEGITGSPGIATTLVGDSSLHEFMLRYEASNEVRRSFIGTSEYITENRGIQDYIPGKYFLLPDRNPENLRVWLEATDRDFGSAAMSDTDNSSYRLLRPEQDYGLVGNLGELSINPDLPLGRILIHYTIAGISLSDAGHSGEIPVVRLQENQLGVSRESVSFSLGEGGNFENHFVEPLNALLGFSASSPGVRLSDYSRELKDGTIALVLYEPGLFSPFEIQAYYPIGQQAEDIRFSGKENNESAILFRADANGLQLLPQTSAERTLDPWKIRYPLISLDDAIFSNYGPGSLQPETSNTLSPYSLQFRSRIGEGIRIEDEIVPGSLFVYRNSVLVSNVQIVDSLLVFPDSPAAQDHILLVYRLPDTSGRLGNITAATGHQFFFPEGDSLKLALGGSIGLTQEEGPQTHGENPAYIQLTAAYRIDRPDFTANFEAAVGYADTDSNSNFQPNKASNNRLAINESPLLPSPPPETGQLQALSLPATISMSALENLDNNTRGNQYFRDFRDAGGILLPRDSYTSGTEPEILNTAIGPYPVLSAKDDTVNGRLVAVEFQMEAEEWVGYQLGTKKTDGFISEVELSVLPESLDQPVHLFLQMGDLGEDVDDDFVLDSQLRPEDSGFSFTHNGNEVYAGYPGRSYFEGWQGITEDTNANGRLDSDNPAAMVSLYLGRLTPADSGRWTTLRSILRSAESHRLRGAGAMRIIIFSENAVRARLFFGEQSIKHSPFLLLAENAKISEGPVGDYTLNWSDSSPLELRIPLASTEYGVYETMEIALNGKDMAAREQLLIGLNASSPTTVPLANKDAWQTLSISFTKQTISLRTAAGLEHSQAFTAPRAPLEYISLKLSPTGGGSLLLREAVFSDSRKLFSAGMRANLRWEPESAILMPNTVLQTGLTSLLFDSSLFSPGFSETSGLDAGVIIRGYLPFFFTSISFRIYWDLYEDLHIDTSHNLSLNDVPGISLNNNYSQQWQKAANTVALAQSLSLSLSPLPWLVAKTAYQLQQIGQIQNRDWSLGLLLGKQFLLTSRLGLGIDEKQIDEPPSNPSYADNYLESLRLIDWTILKSEQYKRNADLDLSLNLALPNFSAEMAAELATDYSSLPYADLSEKFTQNIQLIFYTDLGLSVTIAGVQRFSHQESTQTKDFFDQIAQVFEHASREPYFLVPIYLGGVFSEEAASAFFRSVGVGGVFDDPRYTSQEYTTNIQFSRRPGSFIYDLLVPAGLSITAERKLAWKQGITADSRSLKAIISWQALNLFGTLGRSPLFSTYTSDEIYMDISYRQNLDTSEDWRIEGQFKPYFFEIGPFEKIENTFDWKWAALGESGLSLGIRSSLVWETPISTDLSTLIDGLNVQDETLTIEHTDTLGLRYTGLRDNSPRSSLSLSEQPGFSISLRHNSSLLFSDIGELGLNLVLAYIAKAEKTLQYKYTHQVGIEMTVNLKISY